MNNTKQSQIKLLSQQALPDFPRRPGPSFAAAGRLQQTAGPQGMPDVPVSLWNGKSIPKLQKFVADRAIG